MGELTQERLAELRWTQYSPVEALRQHIDGAGGLRERMDEGDVTAFEADVVMAFDALQSTIAAQAEEIARLRTLEARFLCDEGKVCGACGGIGFRSYGSTSAWRGGAGGQTVTEGICDRCWGTGNEGKPGPNLRRIEARIARLERDRETLAAAVMAWEEYRNAALGSIAEVEAVAKLREAHTKALALLEGGGGA